METEEFNFGENLRIIRDANGVTEEEVAAALGKSLPDYMSLESQVKLPPHEVIKQLVAFFKEDQDVFMPWPTYDDMRPDDFMGVDLQAMLSTSAGRFFYFFFTLLFMNISLQAVGFFIEIFEITNAKTELYIRSGTMLVTLLIALFWAWQIRRGRW
ncbi:MAG: XRE family transcriptional regulator [Pedobacter sp.]|nr:MAG: XRE family transcriptional regulator [Pedobacter sp.]